MIINEKHLNELSSINQRIKAKVELFNGSTLTATCTCSDVLQDFTIEKIGEGKFFGFGICQKLIVNLIDIDRVLEVTPANTIKVAFGVDEDYIYPYPIFKAEAVERDETTNSLNISAYDALYKLVNYTIADLALDAPYTLEGVAQAAAALIGTTIATNAADSFNITYEQGANFDGTENLRDVLNDIAEVTQTVYYIDRDGKLYFKRLPVDEAAAYTLAKDTYFSFKSGEKCILANICSATELGDNVISTSGIDGVTQYIRENPFLNMRDDVQTLIDAAASAVAGMSINAFSAEWIGNYLLEIGDKIELVTDDNALITSYLLEDTISYDGTLYEVTAWSYNAEETEAANPTSLGEAIKQTFARVDKANKQIDLMASDVEANTANISSLMINTESINATVQSNNKVIDELNGAVSTLSESVSAAVTSDQLAIEIQKGLENGTQKVTTATGFTFDENGLTVEKSDAEMRTLITEDGMTVYKRDDAVLEANNEGVRAANLHATTYLIVGVNSRFEDYENGTRTGCFWING